MLLEPVLKNLYKFKVCKFLAIFMFLLIILFDLFIRLAQKRTKRSYQLKLKLKMQHMRVQ